MNYGKILSVGFKVLVAAVAGVAVFIGVDKINANNGNQNQPKQRCIPDDDPCFSSPRSEFQPNNDVPVQQVKRSEDDSSIVEKMKNVQDTCGKLFTFVQSLTMVVDNFSRIFRNDGSSRLSQPYYGDPWGYRQPINMGNGVYWNRISPYIIEASSTPDPRCYGRL